MRLIPFTLLALLLFANSSRAASSRPSASSKPARLDVFESFRVLDTHLTKLDGAFHDLQSSVAKKQSTKTAKRAWQHGLREMRATTNNIDRVSYRMYVNQRRLGRRLGSRMFLSLRRKAQVLHRSLLQADRTMSRTAQRRAEQKVRKAMLDLVLQYQALSGGYSAAHCDAGAWSCGVEKKEPRTVGYPAVGVKWMCVPRVKSCPGILGPRTPMLVTHPLTADKALH
jgi:hypothetical protein